jgi:hypothetical protein
LFEQALTHNSRFAFSFLNSISSHNVLCMH